MARGDLSVREAGRLGGQKRKAELGSEGYAAMGRRGGAQTARRHGAEHYAQIGQRGGEARKAVLGSEGYAALARKGGQRVRDLCAEGRRMEAEGGGVSAPEISR